MHNMKTLNFREVRQYIEMVIHLRGGIQKRMVVLKLKKEMC